jgi:hypothetical protein
MWGAIEVILLAVMSTAGAVASVYLQPNGRWPHA